MSSFFYYFIGPGLLIAQVINLSSTDVFRYYAKKYGISTTNYSFGLYGLELRKLRLKDAESVYNSISANGESVYKYKRSDENINLFLIGSIRKFKIISERIPKKSSGILSVELFNTINFFENYELTNYKLGDKLFEFNKAYIMGIINITPDSFSNGGEYFDRDKAVNYAFKIIDEGADVIDIGGESSRPGAEGVDTKIEIERVIPVVKKILEEIPNAIISVDTKKQEVAERALDCGVKIINDISGGTYNPEIMKTVANYNAAYVIMHMKGTPEDMQTNPSYENITEEVYDFLYKQVRKAKFAGINHIFVDPGIGFGKRTEDNFILINRLDDFKSLSYPIMIGVSRKSFIRNSLNLPVEATDVPTSMMESLSLSKGARIIRTHNVQYGLALKELFNITNNSAV